MLQQKSQLSLEQDLRHESEAALVKARSDMQEEQQRARKLEAGRAASEARAAELSKKKTAAAHYLSLIHI